MRARLDRLPLLWRVFLANAAVMIAAATALAVTPATVSTPVAAREAVVLAVGLGLMLAIDLVLLRRAFAPLRSLSAAMAAIDPLAPGRRVALPADPDVGAVAASFNAMLARLEDERRESGRRALQVQEAERRRVALELHDEVGQILTAIVLQVEGIAARVPAELAPDVEELRETARLGAQDVSRIAARLRPEALEHLGLRSALSSLAASVAEHAGLALDRRLEAIPALGEERELVVYRVAQEALTNVARHADATEVMLRLAPEDGAVVLRVRDDGRGLAAGAETSSAGIRGMRERAMLVGAAFAVRPADGGGTEVTLRIPVTA